jgi:hypothetical protein
MEKAVDDLRNNPIQLGFMSGLLGAAWAAFLLHDIVLGLALGTPFGALMAFLWRKNGPAHKWRDWLLEHFPAEDQNDQY